MHWRRTESSWSGCVTVRIAVPAGQVPRVPPLSTRPAPADSGAKLPSTISLIGKFRLYSWGVLLGLGLAGAIYFFTPALRDKVWLDAPLALSCVVVGMLVERAVRYFIGWNLNARLQHLAARREAHLELAKLRDYEKRGLISHADARVIAARIAKRDVAGGARPGKPRGPYKKRRQSSAPPPGSAAGPDSPASDAPAA
jgi:hypothetical protein